ncbi:peptidase M24, structural domain-containing protein [Suillus fuscotomentosus]|uniref:Peptidase M24, structural domain-containing protein n=1 Tax=Suillus fuscotomentosus TaxID=1912939 RepID=A0AAD4E685_9AGAM|nr:peptidase M24, structural domain-containing protein [Suillus fuscotomentosus]KAG1900337.1 peptidase M24, structural domain-containing protein [Suillus fuscotomentosus]
MWSRCSLWALRAHSHRYLLTPVFAYTVRFSSGTTATMGAIKTRTVNTTERLAKLRELLKKPKNNVKAFIVPSEDQHFSEYPAHSDERRAFISGFNGSAGCAVITLRDAFLFTDGRYFLQASQQLDSNWKLMKQGLPDVPTWQEFLSKHLEQGTRIGIDPTLISAADAESLKKSLEPRGSVLVSLQQNPVDVVWGKDRPPCPHNSVFPLDVKYAAGETSQSKLQRLREEITKKKAVAAVVTLLDEVAWLFNLRGTDIDFNPVFFAYAVVTPTEAILFMNDAQDQHSIKEFLGSDVEIRPYESFIPSLRQLTATLGANKDKPMLLGDKTSLAVVEAIGQENAVLIPSPVATMKAIKNETEIEGFRNCHIRDGAALIRYFAWLEEQLNSGVELNESQAAAKLEEFRSELDLFRGLSFTTISSTGPNAAVIHYSPDPDDCAIVKKDQIYLCDSGGQYLDGTTDVTRTLHFGTPTNEEKRAFTRVLQGHISIDTAVFPNGTSGADSFARRALWQEGWGKRFPEYRHGTGHGVGHFLNVHEGPHGIGTRIAYNSTSLKVGMTVSNEPGYYADGRYGIRIENVVIVREAETPNNFGNGYLCFEHVTMCPIQTKLIDFSILTAQEKEWLNSYHAETLEKVGPLLRNDPRALEWLERECSPV